MTVEEIKENIIKLRGELPCGVKLVAVSKFHPMEALMAAYDAGQRLFGESRAQEIGPKHTAMPKDVEWHFIGHLQSNKVRQIVPYVSLVHSIDSLKLLRCVDDEARELVDSGAADALTNVCIRGVMGMATNTDDEAEIRREFREIRHTFDSLKSSHFASNDRFDTVSMGMSDDYHIAVEEGSTMVRIGTSIFGAREY